MKVTFGLIEIQCFFYRQMLESNKLGVHSGNSRVLSSIPVGIRGASEKKKWSKETFRMLFELRNIVYFLITMDWNFFPTNSIFYHDHRKIHSEIFLLEAQKWTNESEQRYFTTQDGIALIGSLIRKVSLLLPSWTSLYFSVSSCFEFLGKYFW